MTAFATMGAYSTAQEIASILLSDISGADPNVVAEETLSLVAVVTARAVESAFQGPSCERVVSTLLSLPFMYHDYLIGEALIRNAGDSEVDPSIYQRLERKSAFYGAHFQPGLFPGTRVLSEKMSLWMGRVSPPGLPEMPTKRLERLNLVERLSDHVRLIHEFGMQL